MDDANIATGPNGHPNTTDDDSGPREPTSSGPSPNNENTQYHSGPIPHEASIFCPRQLSSHFVELLLELENEIGMPVCLLVQTGGTEYDIIDNDLSKAMLLFKERLPKNSKIALVIDSPGGIAMSAYEVATLLRRHCGGYVAIVPRYAKSAATLLALGADQIYLGSDGELGPLDAQFNDPERETRSSALDEVQSLERLNAFALQATHQLMISFVQTAQKRIDVLLPIVLKFVSDMMRPLLEDIDAVHYTQMSRALKIAEEYAVRLLARSYPEERAQSIAFNLVSNYPEHGFPIYAQEARDLGLQVEPLSPRMLEILDKITRVLLTEPMTAIGPLAKKDVLHAEESSAGCDDKV